MQDVTNPVSLSSFYFMTNVLYVYYYSEILTMDLQPFYGKGPHPVLWAGLGATLKK
jgi:hypothetical protein